MEGGSGREVVKGSSGLEVVGFMFLVVFRFREAVQTHLTRLRFLCDSQVDSGAISGASWGQSRV